MLLFRIFAWSNILFCFRFQLFWFNALICPCNCCLCPKEKSRSIVHGFSPYHKDPPSHLYFLLQRNKKAWWQSRKMLLKCMWPSMLARSIAEFLWQVSFFIFSIFRCIDMCIDNWKQAVLFAESYWYINMGHINDTPIIISMCFYCSSSRRLPQERKR